jgi:CheY-like chemotaxis protein
MKLKDAIVLIADDELGLLRIFRMWFEREGCRVLTAENGREALQLATDHHVDVLISDIRMPVLDGIELAKRLNATGTYLPKIIFVSGFTDLSEREACALGAQAMLAKPIRRAELVSAVDRSLMDLEERWRQASHPAPETVLDVAFESLVAAGRDHLIAFGHGGFCVRSRFNALFGETIGLNVAFDADQHTLAGQGVVRWAAPDEGLIGIEISCVDDANRAWVSDLARHAKSVAFVPDTC